MGPRGEGVRERPGDTHSGSGLRTPVKERVVRVIVKMNKRTGRRHGETVKTGSSSIQNKEALICSQVVEGLFDGCSHRWTRNR